MSIRLQAEEMLRLARTPRWIGLALLAVAFMVGCVLLGRWQWDRTQDIVQAERASQSAAIPVEGIAAPGTELPNESIGRPVVARGRYLAEQQVLVLHRSFEDRPGVWVLTPLELTDGTVVGVLRGWLPDATSPGLVPASGLVTVEGIMHPDERFYPDAVTQPGTVVAITSGPLAQEWGPQTRPGYVMLTAQQPNVEPAPRPALPTVQTSDVAFPLQNFFYAFQWWVFALFALGVYFRWLWIESTMVDNGEIEDLLP
jgi:cytochrome oxidase assembly protein ShyY1